MATPKFCPENPAVCVMNGKTFPAHILGRRKTISGSTPVMYLVDYGDFEEVCYFHEDGSSDISSDFYMVNTPGKRTVWRYTVVVPGSMFPDTFYHNTEELARENLAKWETVEGAIVLEPPHPFEYEVTE